MPLLESTVAMPGKLLYQKEPEVGSDSVVVMPTQMVVSPEIACGTEDTAIVSRMWQPVDVAVWSITDVPAELPCTTPLDEPMLAGQEMMLHVPGDATSESVALEPTQTYDGPET